MRKIYFIYSLCLPILMAFFILTYPSTESEGKGKGKKYKKLKIKGFSYMRTQVYTCNGQSHRIYEYRHKKTGMVFALLPPGSFQMGSSGTNREERPVHKVQVPSFLMGKYEVTQEVYEKITGENPSHFKMKKKNLPVEKVSWKEASEFAEKAGLELPSESQWEYACRAGTTSKFYWGQGKIEDYVWYRGNSWKKTHAIGRLRSNAFGLHDMVGNVYEWCRDWYYPSYMYAPKDGSARTKKTYINERVARGGAWDVKNTFYFRSASRMSFPPSTKRKTIGFRVCAPVK